jgi:type VII secretion-associated serine protease mycosin
VSRFAAALILAVAGASVGLGTAGAATAAPGVDPGNGSGSGSNASSASTGGTCQPPVGVREKKSIPYAQTRLDFATAWQVTTGEGVKVGVIDSGLGFGTGQRQVAQIKISDQSDVLDGITGIEDCQGHGTAVASIIAAPKIPGIAFQGGAPGVSLVVVKQSNTTDNQPGTAAGLAQGIDDAVQAGAKVINISITTQNSPALRAAITRAAAADVVIVAAAGNNGGGNNEPDFPAAYSPAFPNILAVAAVDQNDQIANFSESGAYVNISAPGVNIEAPAAASGYSYTNSGTSFAAPFVTAAAALVRASHPELDASAVVRRIEGTADTPAGNVPDPRYGYGIVNPALAVTSLRDDRSAFSPSPTRGEPLPAPRAGTADKSAQNTALGVTGGLVGVAAVIALWMAVRQAGRSRRPT